MREKTASVLHVWEMRTLSFATPHRANIMQDGLIHPKTRVNTHVDMTCLRLVCLGSRCMCTMAHHSGYVVILLQLGLWLCVACSAVILVPHTACFSAVIHKCISTYIGHIFCNWIYEEHLERNFSQIWQ